MYVCKNTSPTVECVLGNMMTSVLKREDGDSYSLQQFVCSNKKETPVENKDLEADFKTFLEKGICMISRTGGIDLFILSIC